MNPLYLIPILPIVFFFAGIYVLFFARKDQARTFVAGLFDDTGREEAMRHIQQQHFVLKKRNKNASPMAQKIDAALDQANWMLKVSEFIWISVASGVVCALIGWIAGKNPGFGLLGFGLGVFLPPLYLKVRIILRMSKARAQFADVLDTMVSCFKSGYGFSRAVQVVAENFDDPWSTELNKVATEMNFGATQEDALFALAKRVPNPDVALFVTAVLIQKETGGNLAELLSNLSHTIRERYKLLGKVNALSAQGKLSATIIFCIPFGLAGMFTLIIPRMMNDFVHHPIGVALMIFALFMQLLGGLVLKRIVTLEV